jgi:hypothetical protein
VKRNAKLALVALAGAAVGAVLTRFRRTAETPPAPPDERAEELRRKLAEARAAVVDEDDFEAAGMGAETLVEEPPRAGTTPPEPEAPAPEPEAPPAEPAPEPEAPAAEQPRAAATPEAQPPPAAEPPPRDEFEAMRRRIHEEGKAAAEEMRRSADPPEQS